MIPIKNTFEVETHPGVTIVNPDIELVTTVDIARDEVFQPTVIIHAENIKIYHVLPLQPYVDGTWTDEDVDNAIVNYFTLFGGRASRKSVRMPNRAGQKKLKAIKKTTIWKRILSYLKKLFA